MTTIEKCLFEILADFKAKGVCQGNYSEGEYNQDYTTRRERVEKAITELETLTQSLAQVTREGDEASRMCEEMRLSFPTTAQIMVSTSIEMSRVSCLKFIRAEADFVDLDEEKRIHEAIDKALSGQSITDKHLIDLQSQLTASHAENARLREALQRITEEPGVLCTPLAIAKEALTPTTPNPVLEELRELRAFKQLYQGGTVGSDVIRLAASKEAKV